ncbi:MAG: hypothetical protein ACYDCF_07690, partial [Burkholderiales bacterium]
MTKRKEVKNYSKRDPEFRSLLTLDPAFEDWRRCAAEWVSISSKSSETKISSLLMFFTTYIDDQKLSKSPTSILEKYFV